MAKLELQTLQCNQTEDFFISDEAYILVNGIKVWPNDGSSANSIRNSQSRNLTTVAPITFTGQATVELFDEDLGPNHPVDEDDSLGRVVINASLAGTGAQTASFTDDGAHYTLTYKVT